MASTLIPLMVVSLNGAKSILDKISVNSVITNGLRKSGLSEPYFNMASVYGILLKGIGLTSLLPNLVKTS